MNNLSPSKKIKGQLGEEIKEILGEDMWIRISRAYLLALNSLEGDLNKSVDDGALERLHAIGHQYKGTSALIGADELAEQFRQLEFIESLEAAQVLIETLVETFADTRHDLQEAG